METHIAPISHAKLIKRQKRTRVLFYNIPSVKSNVTQICNEEGETKTRFSWQSVIYWRFITWEYITCPRIRKPMVHQGTCRPNQSTKVPLSFSESTESTLMMPSVLSSTVRSAWNKKETHQHNPTSYNGMWDQPWETGGRTRDRSMVREEAAEPAEVVSTWQHLRKHLPSLLGL